MIYNRNNTDRSQENSSKQRARNSKIKYRGPYQDVPWFSFDGRIGRVRAFFYQITVGIPLFLMVVYIIQNRIPGGDWMVLGLKLLSSLFYLGVQVRRAHDLGVSGGIISYPAIFILALTLFAKVKILPDTFASLPLIALLCFIAVSNTWASLFPGQNRKNDYGDPPKPSNALMQGFVVAYFVMIPFIWFTITDRPLF